MKKRTRAIVATTLALATVGAFRTVAALSDDKPAAAAMVDGSPVADAPAPEPGVTAKVPYTEPIAIAPPPGVACLPGWSYFDDQAMHYGLCYPPGWGFTEYDSSAPLTSVRSQTLTDLHIASPNAFPWTVGDSNFDGIVNRGISEVELDLFDPNASNEDGCALAPVEHDGRTYDACSQYLDDTGSPASAGPIGTLSVRIPLASPVTSVDPYPAPDGASLLVIARGPAGTFSTVEDLAWKLVASVNAY